MRKMLALSRCFIQRPPWRRPTPPPTVGDKPLVQVKPQGTTAAKPPPTGAAPKGKPQSIAGRLQACLEIDDGTKDRLDCYDAIFPPTPKPEAGEGEGRTPIAASSRKKTSG